MRRLRALALPVLALALTAVAPVAADASTKTHNGLRSSLPSTRTVHRGDTVTLRPNVRVVGGANRQILSKQVVAYRHGKRVAAGKSVRLARGHYRVATTVRYRAFTYVTKRSVVTVHRSGVARGTSCLVTVAPDYQMDTGNVGGDIKEATCTNADYPGQSIDHHGPIADYDCSFGSRDRPYPYAQWYCTPGMTVTTNSIVFAPYDGPATVSRSVRQYGPSHTYRFPRRSLTVR